MSRRIALGAGAGVLLAAFILAAYWLSVYILAPTPEWYSKRNVAAEYRVDTGDEEVLQAMDTMEQVLAKTGRAVVPARAVAPVMIHEVKRRTGLDLGPTMKAAKWDTGGGRVVVKMIVDITKLPRDKLPHKAAKAIDRFLAIVPDAMVDEISVAVDFRRSERDGALELDSISTIRVGKMKFDVKDVEKRTGLNGADVLQKIGWRNLTLPREGFTFQRRE